jgi:hypothetical protein
MIAVKAAALGVTDAYKSMASSSTSAGQDIQSSMRSAAQASADLGNTAKSASIEMSGAMGATLSAMADWVGEFGKHSKAAADEYQKLVRSIFESGFYRSTESLADLTGITRLGDAISEAARRMKQSLNEQLESMQKVAASYANLSDEQLQQMAVQAGGLENLQRNLRAMAQAASEGSSQFSQLGANDLGPLVSGLESAAQKAAQLAERGREAKREFSDLAENFRVQIAQMEGDQAKAENLQFKQQLEQLEAKAKLAGALNSQEYADAVAQATKLHQLRLKQIEEQAAASRAANRPGNAGASASGDQQGNQQPAGSGSLQMPSSLESKLKISLEGKDLGVIDPNNLGQLSALAAKLMPAIIAEVQKLPAPREASTDERLHLHRRAANPRRPAMDRRIRGR